MNFKKIAAQFQEAQQAVKSAIRSSDLKIKWFIKGLGLTQSAFYARYSTGNWTAQQLEKIALLLEGKGAEPTTALFR